jgi:hypothetical protein
MESEDWLKSVEKKLEIAQCFDHETVLFAVNQLFGTAVDWWETYRNTHVNANAISWNEFKAHFRTHYVSRDTLKLKKKEFSDLNQGGMTVNEYLNQFIQLSKYAIDDINTDEKKQGIFLKGLNDEILFQLLNTDYPNFQHLVDKAIIIENKLKEMEKDGKHKMVFSRQHSRNNHQAPLFTAQSVCQSPVSELCTDAGPMPVVSELAFSVPDAPSQLLDVASHFSSVPSLAVGILSSCAATQAECTTSFSSSSPTPIECCPLGRSSFWCMFQVWIAR